LVALSNLGYVLLAYWLAKKHFRQFAKILLVVAIVSTYFHLNPENDWGLILDCITASLSSTIVFYKILPYVQPSPLFAFTVSLSVTSFILWLESGTDREESKYVWMHSAWHILTALSFYLIIQCTPLKTGDDLGKLPVPILGGLKK
jgi:hypothetical protein